MTTYYRDRRGLRRPGDELIDRSRAATVDQDALYRAEANALNAFQRGSAQEEILRDANALNREVGRDRRDGKEGWEAKRAQAEKFERQAQAFNIDQSDLRNVGSLSDAGRFAAFHLGSEAGNAGTSLLGGAVMAAGTKAKSKALTNVGRGIVAGQAWDDYKESMGGAISEQLQDPDMLKADPKDAYRAAQIKGGAEILTGAVPVASGMKIAGRLLNKGVPVGGRIAKAAGSTAVAGVAEGLTEVGSDLIGHAANVALANKQKSIDPWDLANSFAAGGVVGGGIHAGADVTGQVLENSIGAVRDAKEALDTKRAAPSTPNAAPSVGPDMGGNPDTGPVPEASGIADKPSGWERIRPEILSGDRTPVDLGDDEGLVTRTKAATTDAYAAAKDYAKKAYGKAPNSISGVFAEAKKYAQTVREQGRAAVAEHLEPKWNDFIASREARSAEVEEATAPLYESADNVEFESVWTAARDTMVRVVDEASVMIDDAVAAMDSLKRDTADQQFEAADASIKSIKTELVDIKDELASIAEAEVEVRAAIAAPVGGTPAQRKQAKKESTKQAEALVQRKKSVAERAKQATKYLSKMAEVGILDASAVVASARAAVKKNAPSWDFRFNGEDYDLGGQFFEDKLKAMASVVDDVKSGGGRAIDALSNIFGNGRDVADAESLLSGIDDASILGADPAETAANMEAASAKNVDLATKFRNSMLKENKLSESALTKLMLLDPRLPDDQKGIAQMYLDQARIQEMEQTLRDVESHMGDEGEAKMSLIGMDQVDPEFVSALAKLLGPSNAGKAPVMSLRIIRAATFLGDPTQFRAGFANELASKINVRSMVENEESFFNRMIDASGVTVGRGDRFEMAQAINDAARKHYDKTFDIPDESMATLETMYKVLESDNSEDRHGPIRGLLAYYAAIHATGQQRDITKNNMNVAVEALTSALTARFQYSVAEMDPSGRLSELVEQYLPADKAPNVDKGKLDGNSFSDRTAVNDVVTAQGDSFLWGLMAGHLGEDAKGLGTMVMNVASFVDESAINFGQLDEFRQGQVLKTLTAAVGDEENARSVLAYYGVAARIMVEQQIARDKEMGLTAIPDGAEADTLITQLAERTDTTTDAIRQEAYDLAGPEYDEEAQKGVLEADEADPNSGFQTIDAEGTENNDVLYNQDSKAKRPFLKGREKDDAGLAQLLEELGPEAQARGYGDVFAAERRGATFDGGTNTTDVQTAALRELGRIIDAVKAVRAEHYKRDRGVQQAVLAEMEARAAQSPLSAENHRKLVAMRKRVEADKFEDRSAMIEANDAEIKMLEDGIVKAREDAAEKRKTGPYAEADYLPLLNNYQVVVTPNDGLGATNEDLRSYRADSNGANTPTITFRFKPKGGKEFVRKLSPVAMVKSKDAIGYTTHERLASVFAKVMARPDYVGFDDPGVQYMLGLKENGHPFRWGDFISAQSQVDIDSMTEASIAKFMEPLESDAVKSARLDSNVANPKPAPEKTLAERLVDRAFGVEEAAARKEKNTQYGKSQGAIQAAEAKEGVLNMLNDIKIETGFKPDEELVAKSRAQLEKALEKAEAEVAKTYAELSKVSNKSSPAYRRADKRYQEAKVKSNKLLTRLNDSYVEEGVLRDWRDFGKERTELAQARLQALVKAGSAVNGALISREATHAALGNKQTNEAKNLMREIYVLRAKNKELARAARTYAEALNPWDSEAYEEQRGLLDAMDNERGGYGNQYYKVKMAEAEIDALRAQINSLRLSVKTGDARDSSQYRNKGKVRRVAEGQGDIWAFAAKPIQEKLKKAETEMDIMIRSIPLEERDQLRIAGVNYNDFVEKVEDVGFEGQSLDAAVGMDGATYLANSFFGLNKKDNKAGGVTPENLNEVARILPSLHAALVAKGVANLTPAQNKLYKKLDDLLTEVAKRQGADPAALTKLIRTGENFGQKLGSGRTNAGKQRRRELWISAMREIRRGMSDSQIAAISGIKEDRIVDLGYVDAVLFNRDGLTADKVLKGSAMIPRVIQALGEQDPNILSDQDKRILAAAIAYSRKSGSDTRVGALYEAVKSVDGLTNGERRQLWLMANAASMGQDAPEVTGNDLKDRKSLMRKIARGEAAPTDNPDPTPPKGPKNSPAKRKAAKDAAAKSAEPAARTAETIQAELDALNAKYMDVASMDDIPDEAVNRYLELEAELRTLGPAPAKASIKELRTKVRDIRDAIAKAQPMKEADITPEVSDEYAPIAAGLQYVIDSYTSAVDDIARAKNSRAKDKAERLAQAEAREAEAAGGIVGWWESAKDKDLAARYLAYSNAAKAAAYSKGTGFLGKASQATASGEVARVNSAIMAKANSASRRELEGMIASARKRLAKTSGGLANIMREEILYMNNLLQTKFDNPAGGVLPEGKMSLSSTPLSGRTEAEIQDIKERAIRGILQTRGDGVTVTFGSLAQIGGAGKYKHDIETRYREIMIALDVADPLGAARHEVMHDFMRNFGASDANRALKKQLLNTLASRKNRALLEAKMRQEGINEEAIKQLKDPEEAAAYFFQYYGENPSFREDFLADPANMPAATVFQKLADWVDSVVNAVYKALGAKTNDEKAMAMLDMLINGEAITNEDFEYRAIDRKLESNWNKFVRITGPIIPGSRKVQFPATHFLRSLNSDAANKIADMFAPEPGSAHTGFMKDKQQTMSTYLNRFEDIVEGMSTEALNALGTEISSMSPTSSEKGAELRKLLDDLYEYQSKAGVATLNPENNEWVPIRKVENYGVRKWNPAAVSSNRAGFISLMEQHMDGERAEALYNAIIAGDGAIEMAQSENDLGYTPFHSSALARQLTFITRDNVNEFMPFIETDIREVMASYIQQAVHRAEYTRAFGNGGALIARLMAQAQAEGVSTQDLASMNAAVKSMQGTLDHPWATPGYKKAVGYAITMQNFALLPLIVLSSMFTDPMGVAVRTGEYKKAGKTMMAGLNQVIRDVRKLDKTKRERLARRLGIVAEDNLLDAMGQSAHSMNMSTTVRKANSKFFALTGIASLTKGLRIGAMGVGMDFILESVDDPKKMEELGLSPEDVHTYVAEDGQPELAVTKEQIMQALTAAAVGPVDAEVFEARAEAIEKRVSKALYNFVDSSIVRPNAAHRPAWASDPRFQIFAYLKQYTWSFREVIVQQAKIRSERDGTAVPIFALMTFVPLMLISDVLRGEIFGTNKGTADIGGMMLGSLARSGVMGVGTFGLDAIEDYNRGGIMNAAAGALGPVADHASDAIGNLGGRVSDERLAARTLPLGSMVRGLKRKYFSGE